MEEGDGVIQRLFQRVEGLFDLQALLRCGVQGIPDVVPLSYVCLKIVYPYTQWLMIIIPTKWL